MDLKDCGYEVFCLLGYNAMLSVESGSACFLLHAGFLLGLFFDLKMEGTCPSQMFIGFQRTWQHYIREDRTLWI
jgi:hypothetical protein